MKNPEKIGEFSAAVIELLALDIPVGTDILLSESTLKHIESRHTDICGDHKRLIADIIAAPSAVSYRAKDATVGFFKVLKSGDRLYLEVSVRASGKNEYFVRTMHSIEAERVEKRLKTGIILGIDNEKKP
jgi:acyl dehydratase